MRLAVLPDKGERQKVEDTLKKAIDSNFDEVVILGFKDGKSFLQHSKIDDEVKLIGAIESMKLRLLSG